MRVLCSGIARRLCCVHTATFARSRNKLTFACTLSPTFCTLVVRSHSPWRFRIMRSFVLLLLLAAPSLVFFSPIDAFACKLSSPAAPAAAPSVQGVVADPTGAIVPGAEVDLIDTTGFITCTGHSSGDGSFQLTAPHTGSYTLVVSEPGFETVHNPVVVAAPAAPPVAAAPATTAHTFAAPLRIILPIAAVATNVRVTADSSEDLTAPEDNHDSSVMTADDLKALPIFDNDYATAMSAFLDDSATATGGTGLIVDGVEANRAPTSS